MPVLEALSKGTVEEAVAAAAEHVTAALIAADIRQPGGPRLAIPGGSALAAMAAVLPALPARVRRRLRLTWVDERCVPTADPASNQGAARRAGLVPDDLAAVHPLWWDDADPLAARRRGEAMFADDLAGALDVALLGLGEDGHVASLFPGRSPAPGFVAHVPDSPKPPAARMTLSLRALQTAGLCVVLATGAGKRGALARLLRDDPDLPASSLARIILVTDLDLETPR